MFMTLSGGEKLDINHVNRISTEEYLKLLEPIIYGPDVPT
jgi:hypothetical protein